MIVSPSPSALLASRVAALATGRRRISPLEVFFCRREYVFVGVLRRAVVGEGVRVRLGKVC